MHVYIQFIYKMSSEVKGKCTVLIRAYNGRIRSHSQIPHYQGHIILESSQFDFSLYPPSQTS